MNKKRLLFVVNDAGFFLSHRLNIAHGARENGWEVHVATPPSREAEEIVSEGFTFHPIALSRRGVHPWEEARSLLSLWRLIRSVRPSLLHAVTIKPVLYCGLLAPLVGVPALVQAISGLGHVFTAAGILAMIRRGFVRATYRVAFRHRNSRVIFQNPDDLAQLSQALRPNQATLIPGAGVNPNVFQASEEPGGAPLVVLASRLLWAKGVAEFVEAARILRREKYRARFILVGAPDHGNPAAVPEATLREWSQEGAVEFWGRQSDMPAIFRQSSIVCLPSFYGEGIPKVLIEAAASARPIVTTDWPGCREIVRHQVNGLLVPVRDPQKLAGALSTLLNNPDLRRQMGQRGREVVLQGFTEDRVVRATLDIYKTLDDVVSQQVERSA